MASAFDSNRISVRYNRYMFYIKYYTHQGLNPCRQGRLLIYKCLHTRLLHMQRYTQFHYTTCLRGGCNHVVQICDLVETGQENTYTGILCVQNQYSQMVMVQVKATLKVIQQTIQLRLTKAKHKHVNNTKVAKPSPRFKSVRKTKVTLFSQVTTSRVRFLTIFYSINISPHFSLPINVFFFVDI